MKIAVLGTGMVGRALAGRLSQLGHEVTVGTRDVADTLARTEPDRMGNPPFGQWQAQNAGVQLAALADAAADAEVVVNATAGATSLAALDAAGGSNLAGKVLVDVANPLDFSQGMPPVLSPASTDSLGEQIQRAHPQARVVKTLNTMSAAVMVDPARLADSHEVFVAGDDEAAKAAVRGLLRELGWPDANILDLGGIRAARGLEMYLALWLSLLGSLGTSEFNLKLVRA
jgi:8-hydroxy-5-deazaflavin:NADPH oxidoreductase